MSEVTTVRRCLGTVLLLVIVLVPLTAISKEIEKKVPGTAQKASSAGAREIWSVAVASNLRSLAVSPDGKVLAAGGNKEIYLLESATGKETTVLRGEHNSFVTTLAIAANNQTMASGGVDGRLRIWDITNGKVIYSSNAHLSKTVNPIIRCLEFNRTGTILASGSWKKVFLWDVQKRAVISQWKPETKALFSGDSFCKNLVSFIDIHLGQPNDLTLWSVETGKKLHTLKGHQDLIGGVSWSSDGKWLASASRDKTVRLWSATTGEAMRTFMMPDQAAKVGFSIDNKWVAAGSGKTVTIWEVATGREVLRLIDHSGAVLNLAFNPKNGHLVTSSHNHVHCWELSLHDLPKDGLPITVEAKPPPGN